MKKTFYVTLFFCLTLICSPFSLLCDGAYASSNESVNFDKSRKVKKAKARRLKGARRNRSASSDEIRTQTSSSDDTFSADSSSLSHSRELQIDHMGSLETSQDLPRLVKASPQRHRKGQRLALQDEAPILSLPDELLYYVGNFLPADDLLIMMAVCRQWRNSLANLEFQVQAYVRFSGNDVNRDLFLRRSGGGVYFLHSSPVVLSKVKDITLLGKYSGKGAPLEVQKQAKRRLHKALHKDLKILRWDRASRMMPLDVLGGALPRVTGLKSLSLTGGLLRSHAIIDFLKLPCLSQLTHLDLSQNNLDGLFLRYLSSIPCAQNLESLLLSCNKLGTNNVFLQEEGQEGLDNGGVSHGVPVYFPRLRRLSLAKNEMTALSVLPCAQTFGICNTLEELDLKRNDLTDEGILAFMDLVQTGAYRCLDLRRTKAQELTFLTHGACKNLRELRLDGNMLEDCVLAVAPVAQTLRVLTLSQAQLLPEHFESLLEIPFPYLEVLTLSSNRLLEKSPLLCDLSLLPTLRHLSLCHCEVPWETIITLIKTRPLEILDVRNNGPIPCERSFWEERMNPDLCMTPTISSASEMLYPFHYTCTQRLNPRDLDQVQDTEDDEHGVWYGPMPMRNPFAPLEDIGT